MASRSLSIRGDPLSSRVAGSNSSYRSDTATMSRFLQCFEVRGSQDLRRPHGQIVNCARITHDRPLADAVQWPIGMRREIQERAFRLAVRVATLRRDSLFRKLVGEVVLRQLIRSTTSVAANLEEATAAQSRADFVSKVSIATKEAREMQYWLRLGHDSGVLSTDEWETLRDETREVAQVVSAIARSAKSRAARARSDE